MKDFKSMIIGFLLATSMFLFMGYTDINPNIMGGKYQVTTGGKLGIWQNKLQNEYTYMMNTQNGELFQLVNWSDDDDKPQFGWRPLIKY